MKRQTSGSYGKYGCINRDVPLKDPSECPLFLICWSAEMPGSRDIRGAVEKLSCQDHVASERRKQSVYLPPESQRYIWCSDLDRKTMIEDKKSHLIFLDNSTVCWVRFVVNNS